MRMPWRVAFVALLGLWSAFSRAALVDSLDKISELPFVSAPGSWELGASTPPAGTVYFCLRWSFADPQPPATFWMVAPMCQDTDPRGTEGLSYMASEYDWDGPEDPATGMPYLYTVSGIALEFYALPAAEPSASAASASGVSQASFDGAAAVGLACGLVLVFSFGYAHARGAA